jgi:hypothetical protein
VWARDGEEAQLRRWRRHISAREIGEKAARVRVRRIEKKTATDVRLKRLRSTFHVMTGRGGRLTKRDGAASG